MFIENVAEIIFMFVVTLMAGINGIMNVFVSAINHYL
jgi:hypothetical protein